MIQHQTSLIRFLDLAVVMLVGWAALPAFAYDASAETSWLVTESTTPAPRLKEDLPLKGGDMPADENEQVLIQVAGAGMTAKVKALLAAGARANAQDTNGARPLHAAAAEGHWEIARLLLLRGADVNAKGENGSTALALAIAHGQRKLVQLLLSNGARLEQRDALGNTALATALINEREDLAQILLAAGARTDVKSGDRRCMAELAATYGSAALVQKMLDMGGTEACQ